MATFQQHICELEDKIIQKQKLEKQLPELYEQQETCRVRVQTLEEQVAQAQEMVSRFEKGGLQTLLYSITGKRQEAIKQAKGQLLQIKEKFEAALAEQQAADEAVDACEKAIYDLDGADRELVRLQKDKERQVRPSDSPVNKEIAEIESSIAELELWRNELQEVIKAGEDVIETAEDVEKVLINALEYSKADVYNSGMRGNANYHKYEAIHEMRSYNEALTVRCKRFQEAVGHAKQFEAVNQPEISNWTVFRDVVIDDIFIDLKVHNNLLESKNQLTELKAAVWKETDKLGGELNSVEREQNRLREEIRRLINEV